MEQAEEVLFCPGLSGKASLIRRHLNKYLGGKFLQVKARASAVLSSGVMLDIFGDMSGLELSGRK